MGGVCAALRVAAAYLIARNDHHFCGRPSQRVRELLDCGGYLPPFQYSLRTRMLLLHHRGHTMSTLRTRF